MQKSRFLELAGCSALAENPAPLGTTKVSGIWVVLQFEGLPSLMLKSS